MSVNAKNGITFRWSLNKGLYMDSVGCDKVYSRKQIKSIIKKRLIQFSIYSA
jgi:hypothetical protein